MQNRKLLFSIFLVVFIDLLGFSLILPLLPFYAKEYNASDSQVGLLVASYAAAQLFGAPVLGRLSDQYGRRPVLLVSIAGNVVGYILLGLAQSIPMLFFSRMLAGITAANISVAQAYISDITDEKNRSRGLGLLGAAFGLGFIIGPAVGGALSRWGYSVPAYLAAVLGTINLLLVIFWLPESLTPERRAAMKSSAKMPLSLIGLWHALQRPMVGPLLHTRLFFGMSFSLFQTIFALYALYRFGLNAQHTGYILAYVGVLSVLVQGVIIGRLNQRYNDSFLILAATALMAFSLLGWAFAPNIFSLLIVLAPIALSGGVLNTVINSAISKSVPPYEIGGMLGFSASLESLTRVISPILGGFMLEETRAQFGDRIATSLPGIFCSFLLIWLVSYVWRRIYKQRPLGN
jgi:MFS transporter, DHA1 family, tetracycline resistance protein